MMSIIAAAKAGAVCIALVSPDTLFCQLPKTKAIIVCTREGCLTPKMASRKWHGDVSRLYGAKE